MPGGTSIPQNATGEPVVPASRKTPAAEGVGSLEPAPRPLWGSTLAVSHLSARASQLPRPGISIERMKRWRDRQGTRETGSGISSAASFPCRGKRMHRIPELDHTRTWTGTIECSGGRMASPFDDTDKGVLAFLPKNEFPETALVLICRISGRFSNKNSGG